MTLHTVEKNIYRVTKPETPLVKSNSTLNGMEKEGKIVVIDDDRTNLSYLTELLDKDYGLVTAASGEEGLKLVEDFKPDIVLLDIMMPGIDGYEVCKRIRSNKNLTNIKILFLTAKVQMAEKLQGYNVGGDDYITKPFDKDEVLAKIKVFLRLKYDEDTSSGEVVLEEKMLDILYRIRKDLNSIVYVKSDSPYCKVFSNSLKDGSYKIRVKIQALENYFKEKNLIRVHRSYLVNPKRILSINRQKNNEYKMLLKDIEGEIAMIPIGRSYQTKVKNAIPNLFPA